MGLQQSHAGLGLRDLSLWIAITLILTLAMFALAGSSAKAKQVHPFLSMPKLRQWARNSIGHKYSLRSGTLGLMFEHVIILNFHHVLALSSACVRPDYNRLQSLFPQFNSFISEIQNSSLLYKWDAFLTSIDCPWWGSLQQSKTSKRHIHALAGSSAESKQAHPFLCRFNKFQSKDNKQ